MDRLVLKGLTKDDFVADTDKKALEALEKVPMFSTLMRKFFELGVDRWLYSWNMAMSVRCGPKQYDKLHAMLKESAKVLDMPEPELYIRNNPFPNASAGGVERPYITVHSSAIDTLTDEELYHLMGHELGHIKCDHVLYMTMARVMVPLLNQLGSQTLGLGDAASWALAAAFYNWLQQAEISADRAGLLVAQDFHTSASANLSLAAGPNRMSDTQSVEGFLDQSRVFNDMSQSDSMGKMLVWLFYGLWATHPMPVYRTKALQEWYEDGSYDKVMKMGV